MVPIQRHSESTSPKTKDCNTTSNEHNHHQKLKKHLQIKLKEKHVKKTLKNVK